MDPLRQFFLFFLKNAQNDWDAPAINSNCLETETGVRTQCHLNVFCVLLHLIHFKLPILLKNHWQIQGVTGRTPLPPVNFLTFSCRFLATLFPFREILDVPVKMHGYLWWRVFKICSICLIMHIQKMEMRPYR